MHSSTIRQKQSPHQELTSSLPSYQLFFYNERQRILSGTDHLPLALTRARVLEISRAARHGKSHKRPHRKAHGKISFRELATVIGRRWKALDDDNRRLLEAQAVLEKERYVEDLQAWNHQEAMKVYYREREEQQEPPRPFASVSSGASDPYTVPSSISVVRGAANTTTTSSPLDSRSDERFSPSINEHEEIQANETERLPHAFVMRQVQSVLSHVRQGRREEKYQNHEQEEPWLKYSQQQSKPGDPSNTIHNANRFQEDEEVTYHERTRRSGDNKSPSAKIVQRHALLSSPRPVLLTTGVRHTESVHNFLEFASKHAQDEKEDSQRPAVYPKEEFSTTSRSSSLNDDHPLLRTLEPSELDALFEDW